MALIQLSSFEAFKAAVENALSQQKSKDPARQPLARFEREYKKRVGYNFSIFKKYSFKEPFDESIRAWLLNELVSPSEGYVETAENINNATANSLTSQGGGKLKYAMLLHYRMHGQAVIGQPNNSELNIRELVADIDNLTFRGAFRLPSGEPLFSWIPDALRGFSYPRIIDFKESYQARRSEFEDTKELLLLSGAKSVAISAAVYGAGGYGKSSLAQELCSDKEIREAFPGGVYWLQFGMEVTDGDSDKSRYRSLNQAISQMLIEQFSNEDRPRVVLEGTDRDVVSLIQSLPNLPILLIADDIWTTNECSWFARGSPFSDALDSVSLLVTTRIESVAQSAAEEVKIQRLTDEASFQLLTHGMDEPTSDQENRLKEIVKRFKGWPLILNLANGLFKKRKGRTPAAIDRAIARYEGFLDNDDIAGWDLDEPGSSHAQKRQKFVGFCIEASLIALGRNRPELLLDLGVFPDDADVPMSVITAFWCYNANPPFNEESAFTLLDLFQDYSFFSSFSEESRTVRLHDEILAYFRRSRAKETPELHKRLLQSIRTHCNGAAWESLEPAHQYGWDYLLAHLEASGDVETANELRTSFHWIKQKLEVSGLSGLLDSYTSKNVDDDAELVGRALGVSSAILAEQRGKLALQLFGRLDHNPTNRIAKLVETIQVDPGYWPRPNAGHLDAPGAETLRISPGVSSKACFSDGEGSRILVAANGRLRSLNGSNGQTVVDFSSGEGPIRRVIICPNRQFVLALGFGRIAWVWDMLTGRRVGQPLEHDYQLHSARFRADGKRIVTVSGGRTSTVWRFVDGVLSGEFLNHEGRVNTAHFNPVNHQILTASTDGSALIWNEDGSCQTGAAMRHAGPVNAAIYRDDGEVIVTASDDMTARMWNARTGSPSGEPLFHDSEVQQATFLEFGQRVLTTTTKGDVWLWATQPVDLIKKYRNGSFPEFFGTVVDREKKKFLTFNGKDSAAVHLASSGGMFGEEIPVGALLTSASFSSDGSMLLTASLDRIAQLWDVKDGERVGHPMQHHFGVRFAEISEDGRRVLSVSNDGTVRLWNIVKSQSSGAYSSNPPSLSHVIYRNDNRYGVTIDVSGNTRLIDGATSRPIGGWLTRSGRASRVAFQADGRNVVTLAHDNSIRKWTTETGALASDVSLKHDPDVGVLDAHLICDGRRLLVRADDQKTYLFDVETGSSVCDPFNDGAFLGLIYSSDGQRFLSRAERSTLLQVRSAVGGETLEQIAVNDKPGEDIQITGAGFSQDGGRLILGLTGGVFLSWDLSSRKLKKFRIKTGQGEPNWHRGQLYFRNDRRRMLHTTWSGGLELWDCVSGRMRRSIFEQGRNFNLVRFRADGRQFFTVSNGRSLHVWNGDTGQLCSREILHDERVIDACFLGTSRYVMTISGGKQVHLWDPTTSEMCGQVDFDSKVLRLFSSPFGDKVLIQTLTGSPVLWNF